ncbi:MAG TPA: hypothetical protein ENL08_03970, partial [Bacteroidetes bacterium]|nr:hypothetical protein [Bacteroidota bacterium]
MSSLKISNSRIFGGSGWNRPTWTDCLLIEDGAILAVGSSEIKEVRSEPVENIDLEGALVLPGLCDAHLHLTAGGRSLRIPDLEGLDQVGLLDALRSYADTRVNSSDAWIKALNWEPWRCGLNAELLDRTLPRKRVIVFTRDLHSCCCSTAALAAAGIGSDTPDPPGGMVERNPDGSPTGILREAALGLIHEITSTPTPNEIERAILEAQDYIVSLGLTAVGEVLETGYEQVYRRLDEENRLKIDIDAWLRIDDWDAGSQPPAEGRRFRLNTLKLFLDGAMGSHTAAMNRPYRDVPDSRGVLFYSDDEILSLVKPAVEMGWRLAIHAIGDRAVGQACRILSQLPPAASGRHRV